MCDTSFFLSFSRQDGSLTDWEERGGFKRGIICTHKNGCGMRRGATCGVRRGAVCGMRRAVRHGVRRVAACGEGGVRRAVWVGGWLVYGWCGVRRACDADSGSRFS